MPQKYFYPTYAFCILFSVEWRKTMQLERSVVSVSLVSMTSYCLCPISPVRKVVFLSPTVKKVVSKKEFLPIEQLWPCLKNILRGTGITTPASLLLP